MPGGPRRLPAIDWLRGLAVVAMAAYHTAWDLGELRLIATDIRAEPGWQLFARSIAASFLMLVGISLVLARRRDAGWRPFLRRLAVIAGAALLVTAATSVVFPDSFIFFGILHCIALSSVLALPALRAPAVLTALAAALCLAAPRLVAWPPVFDAPALAFLGLGSRVPVTNDYVPVFPWFGFVLLGIVAARLAGRLSRPAAAAGTPTKSVRGAAGAAGGWLAGLGRHSLLIYLLHQPLIFGALWAWSETVGRSETAEAAPFLRACRASCREATGDERVCRQTCTCTEGELKRAGLWKDLIADRLSPDGSARVAGTARLCLDRAR